ncbi:MAG: DNA alkylation repair protein [Archangium sp.]
MAEFTLKSFFSAALVQRMAGELAKAHPAFPSKAFIRDASRGLDELELLDRARHLARALATHLPRAFPDAVEVLLRSLGPQIEGDENLGLGMAPFFYLPALMFIAEHGVAHFDLALDAQREITKRCSAESSIRTFIAHDPERAWKTFEKWVRDDNAHVRRLVTEGTRLRLPWAMRVPWLDANPKRIVAILDQLKDDSSSMVRRSIANNLNDLGKFEPELVFATCERWLKTSKGEETRAMVEHALRTAVKRGDARALKLLGFGGKPSVKLEDVRFEPQRVPIGQSVDFTFSLRSTSKQKQDLLVDAAVHFVKAKGTTFAKVFKLNRVSLEPGASAALRVRVSLKVHTTRKPQPGTHRVDVLVNGVSISAGKFEVSRAKSAPRR